MMIRSLRFCCVLLVSLFASACGDSTSEQVCTPGTEVFCKCRGGSVQGTQTCADDGQSLGECTTPEGECPSIGTGTTDGPIGICTPDEVITCTCDNADQGTKTCSGDGLSFTDCTTPDGPCGSSQTGTEELYSPCDSASECLTGVCENGYCTRSCESYVECYDDAKRLYGDCAEVPLSSGVGLSCVPYCIKQEECSGYGATSVCNGAIALDDINLAFAGCANWGEAATGMPYGTLCDSNSGEVLYLNDVIEMSCDLGLASQNVCTFDTCTKGCYEDSDCPNADCNSNGEVIGCCISDPECN